MSKFSDSGSKWERFAARNEGRLVSGFVREALGGAAFVISLVQMNTWLLVLPQWVSALVLCR